jgi:histidyl-tRNA synthetase
MTAPDKKPKIYKPRPVSGFPEWLPEVRLVEQRWMDHIRRVFESYGFCSIETPSVEELDVLTAKGEVDKEIYVIERLHKDDSDRSETRLALHFDQTVPLARYVAMHFNDLVFPFKRYQMQRVWRGERPQLGRSREFYQCDIDVIGVDNLPAHFDAELPAVIYEAMAGLDIGRIQIRISNRKILIGVMEALSIANAAEVLRQVDKLDKIPRDTMYAGLKNLGLHDSQVDAILEFIQFRTSGPQASAEIVKHIDSFSFCNSAMREGAAELAFVLDQLRHLPPDAVIADLSIVRGLDYYTGTVYETRLLDIPEFTGSVCSGGRYDDLAGGYISKHLPGVGISIGFTRLFEVLQHYGHISTGAKSPTDILLTLPSEDRRAETMALAQTLRKRGFNVEMYHAAKKIPDQLKYASRKGIPYVWFAEDGNRHQVKNMITGEQISSDPATWVPEGKETS